MKTAILLIGMDASLSTTLRIRPVMNERYWLIVH